MTTTDQLKNVTRKHTLDELKKAPALDVAIIGGGIHGAVVARQLSSLGIKVALFEKQDYASGTSSRSSKMAHGGLRYLEMFDFEQVFEGIKAREELFNHLPNLVHPYPFLIPVSKRDYWFRLKLNAGLFLYDMMVKSRERRHRWIPRKKLSFHGFSNARIDLMGCFQYFDGLLNDARLVLENILAARINGVHCLNYVAVTEVSQLKDDRVSLSLLNMLDDSSLSLSARLVINCSGTSVGQFCSPDTEAPSIRYSQGTHLLFSIPWTDPALFLPMEGESRYYFVWPHPSGTMVGTTERELEQAPDDAMPFPDEVQEILKRLARDLPDSGLNRDSLHYGFAGIRTLPVREQEAETGTVSRKHIWHFDKNVLSLFGGKLTTSEWTAEEGVQLACSHLGLQTIRKEAPLLPGGLIRENARRSILNTGREHGFREGYIDTVLKRYGEQAGTILSSGKELLESNISTSEIDYLIDIEQATSIEDILRRRTTLEFFPGHGLEVLESITMALQKRYPEIDSDAASKHYKEKMAKLHDILFEE